MKIELDMYQTLALSVLVLLLAGLTFVTLLCGTGNVTLRRRRPRR